MLPGGLSRGAFSGVTMATTPGAALARLQSSPRSRPAATVLWTRDA